MKRTVRHTLRVLSLAAASALLLAGCSGGGDASEGGDSAGSVTLKIWVSLPTSRNISSGSRRNLKARTRGSS